MKFIYIEYHKIQLLMSLIELSKEDFETLFFSTMKKLVEKHKNNEKKKYIIKYYDGNIVYGVNIAKINIIASSPYEIWLKYNSYLYYKLGEYKEYNHDLICDVIHDEMDNDEFDITNMEHIVNACIDLFGCNDTLWYEKVKDFGI